MPVILVMQCLWISYKCTKTKIITAIHFGVLCSSIYSSKVWQGGGKFGELTLFEHLANLKKFWRINRSANRFLTVNTNLDGFSLVNHGQFTKFAKPSPAKLSCYIFI